MMRNGQIPLRRLPRSFGEVDVMEHGLWPQTCVRMSMNNGHPVVNASTMNWYLVQQQPQSAACHPLLRSLLYHIGLHHLASEARLRLQQPLKLLADATWHAQCAVGSTVSQVVRCRHIYISPSSLVSSTLLITVASRLCFTHCLSVCLCIC